MPDQLTQLPHFTWHSNDQSTVSLRTASETKITNKTKQNKNSQDESEGFVRGCHHFPPLRFED